MNNAVMINKIGLNIKAEEKKMRELVESVLTQAKAKGASAAEVTISTDTGFSVNVRMGQVDTLEYQRDKSLGLCVYFGQQKGSASISDLSTTAIEQAVRAACDIAKYTEPDPCHGLADKQLMAFDYPDVDAYYPWSLEPQQAIELAKAAEAKMFALDPRISNSEGIEISTVAGLHTYANSHGFIGVVPATRHSINCVPVAEEKGLKQRDYAYTVARDPVDLQSIDQVVMLAAEKTLRRLGAKPLSTRSVPVIFSAELAKGIIGCLVAAVSGGNLYRKASFLLDSLGQSITPEWLTITEQPHMKKMMGSCPYDAEGVLTKEQVLVEKGILSRYVLGSYSARKLGLTTTGNAGGVNNLVVGCKNISFEQLLAEMGTGFYATELIGHGVNIVSGDYSRGAAGFWVENGKIVAPVEEVTLAGNLKEMLLNIRAISHDIDRRGNIQSGSMLINAMQLAGR